MTFNLTLTTFNDNEHDYHNFQCHCILLFQRKNKEKTKIKSWEKIMQSKQGKAFKTEIVTFQLLKNSMTKKKISNQVRKSRKDAFTDDEEEEFNFDFDAIRKHTVNDDQLIGENNGASVSISFDFCL
jgi:hypothetical protein